MEDHYDNELDRLAKKHGTDKCTERVGRLSPKGYTVWYSKYFSSLKNEPIKLLEIGIAQGASLRMWEEYFPNGEIFGIDILPECKSYETERTKVFIGDQTDKNFLQSVIEQTNGPLDIIIDDGGHKMSQHMASLALLFSHLSPGGIYAIEDLHTAYSTDYEGGYKRENSTIEYLKTLIDNINGVSVETSKSPGQNFLPQIRRKSLPEQPVIPRPAVSIESVHFYKSLAFLFAK